MEARTNNPNRSPADPEPAGLVGGYDGQRSLLRPPIKESTYYANGQLKTELIDYLDRGWDKNKYYESGQLHIETSNRYIDRTGPLPFKRRPRWQLTIYTESGQLSSERIEEPDHSGSRRFYYNGRLRDEWIDNPDGGSSHRVYWNSGHPSLERIWGPNLGSSGKDWYPDGQLSAEWACDPDGSREFKAYGLDGNLIRDISKAA